MTIKNIDMLMEEAAEHLPEGWQIRIMVENGWAGVILEDPNLLCHDMCCDDSIEEQFNQAVEYAKKHA